MKIDQFRQGYLVAAELLDAFRIFPRVLVGGYTYLLYVVVTWYMGLVPYVLEGCVSDVAKDCIIQAPLTQHAALVTAVIGIAAAIFGLYTSTGRKWNGFTAWNKKRAEADAAAENKGRRSTD